MIYTAFTMVLAMSALGFAVVTVLLLLKPVMTRFFPARLQYAAWIIAGVFMLVPFWRLVPTDTVNFVSKQAEIQQTETAVEDNRQETDAPVIIENVPFEYREIELAPEKRVRLMDLLAYIWLAGTGIFILAAAVSYVMFLIKRLKGSLNVEDNVILEQVKKELKIKRRIRVRTSPEVKSPMLIGALFPVVYLPMTKLTDEQLRMVFLHELTHCKRGDLLIKWFSLFVNALHWFNPMAYLFAANVNESCEIACDMAVTRNMSDDEQKLYMAAILDLLR